MRELKFRIWNKEDKKYVSPSHIAINGNGILLITNSGMYLDFKNEHYSHLSQKYVVQQYTGLKDKNGVDIYEGDITINHISYDESSGGQYENPVGVVKWISQKDKMDYSGWYAYPADLPWGEENNTEVIGNIFENYEATK